MSRQRTNGRAIAVTAAIAWAYALGAQAADVSLALSGAQEVPPVNTAARGAGTLKINDDGAVSGSVKTTNIQATAAHIHSGERAQRRAP